MGEREEIKNKLGRGGKEGERKQRKVGEEGKGKL